MATSATSLTRAGEVPGVDIPRLRTGWALLDWRRAVWTSRQADIQLTEAGTALIVRTLLTGGDSDKEMVLMSRVRLAISSLVVALSAGALFAGPTLAAINFEWKVAGAKLGAGESKGFTLNNDSKLIDLHGSVAGFTGLLLTHEASLLAGAKLIGGVPGTGEAAITLKGVTIDGALSSCGVIQAGGAAGTIQGVPLKTEIVEGASGGVGNGEVLVLFSPKVGETLDTFELTGSSCGLKGTVTGVTGLLLGLPLPQKTEVVKQNLVFEANTKEYRNHAGEFKTAGILFAGNNAGLSGLGLVLLESGQAYGPF
jgi:hypothetical protein